MGLRRSCLMRGRLAAKTWTADAGDWRACKLGNRLRRGVARTRAALAQVVLQLYYAHHSVRRS
jgi:hypothetical protein